MSAVIISEEEGEITFDREQYVKYFTTSIYFTFNCLVLKNIKDKRFMMREQQSPPTLLLLSGPHLPA